MALFFNYVHAAESAVEFEQPGYGASFYSQWSLQCVFLLQALAEFASQTVGRCHYLLSRQSLHEVEWSGYFRHSVVSVKPFCQ